MKGKPARRANARWVGRLFGLLVVLSVAAGAGIWLGWQDRAETGRAAEPFIVTIGPGDIENAIGAAGSVRATEPDDAPDDAPDAGSDAGPGGAAAGAAPRVVESEVLGSDIVTLADVVAVYVMTLRTGERRWYGDIRSIEAVPVSAGDTARYTIRFEVDDPDADLDPGRELQVFFVTSFAEDVLTVPLGALHENATVELVRSDGTIELREVVIGATDRVNAEVLSGLERGDRVVAGYVIPEVENRRDREEPESMGDRLFAPR